MKYTVSFTVAVLLSYLSFRQQGSDFIDSVDRTIESTKEELLKIKEGYYVNGTLTPNLHKTLHVGRHPKNHKNESKTKKTVND